jgi:putative phage-type endonuclease
MALTAEQLAERTLSLGSSDAAPAIGVEAFGRNRITLWQEKTGRLTPPALDSRQIRRGNFLEEFIAREFALEHGFEVRKAPKRQHPKHPWMTARPDYKVVGKPIIVECKSVSPFAMNSGKWGDELTDEIPTVYLAQCVHQLIVGDFEVCYLAAMFADTLKTYVVERNRDLEQAILDREAEFWHHVETDHPPSPATIDEVLELYPRETGGSVVASPVVETACRALAETKERLKEVEADKATHEDIIKMFMGEHGELLGADGAKLATWFAARSGGTDWKALASLLHFENEGLIFPNVHHAFRFVLLCVAGATERVPAAEFDFFIREPSQLRDLGRRSIGLIRQNYGMSIMVNASGLLVSAAGAMSPVVAAILHNASSVAVVGNSSRLIRYRLSGPDHVCGGSPA